jgi:hypothetical protein
MDTVAVTIVETIASIEARAQNTVSMIADGIAAGNIAGTA